METKREKKRHCDRNTGRYNTKTAIQSYGRNRGYNLEEVDAYLDSGDAYKLSNQIQTAIQHYEKALEIAKERRYKQGETNAYLELGYAYRFNNQTETAIQHYEKALEIAIEQGYKQEETNAYLGLGDAYRINNQIQTAIQHHGKALKIATERGYKQEETNAYLGLGHAYRFNNQIQTAIHHYVKALEIATELGYKQEETNAYLGLGHAYRMNNQIQKAVQHYEKSLEIATERGYEQEETNTYLGLGYAYRLNNQIQTAIQHYGKALEIATGQGYEQEETNAHLGLGHAYRMNNQIQTAVQHYKKALEIATEGGYKQEETNTYLGLGYAYRLNNQIQTAIQYCEKALEIAKERRYKQEEINVYLGLGYAYGLSNQIGTAIEYYEKALEIATKREYKLQENLTRNAIKEFSKCAEIEPKREEIHQDEKEIWFKKTFLDSKRKLKEEIHAELKSFPWLCGAYGLTAPTQKIARPHIYLTVKRGVRKSDVRCDLVDKFKCDAKEYFELLHEPKRKPRIKLLGRDQNMSSVESNPTSSVTSVKAVVGGGVLACIKNSSNNLNPLRVLEENERDDIPVPQGTGTLTMFCAHDEQHYALTCFHVGCATDQTCLNATLNEKENIQEIWSSLSSYEQHAKEQQYYFEERVAVENNNEPITFGDSGSNYTPLGDFHNYQFDNKCDIMSLKVSKGTEINCKILDITSPNWKNIWDELYERVISTGDNSVIVEKLGFSSALTYGHIVPCDFSSIQENESFFQDAIVVEGCSGPFLKGGDSGSLVFLHDKNDQKQVLAYGVCELDELPALIFQHQSTSLPLHANAQPGQPTTSIDDDSDGSSIWSGEDYSCSSSEDEAVNEDEAENEDEDKYEDVEVIFQEDSTGPYFICLRLDTALENLGLDKAACFGHCGGN